MMDKLNICLCLILAVCSCIDLSAAESCTNSISRVDFYSYVGALQSCQVTNDVTQLQNEFPIASQAFKLDGTFDKDAIDYDAFSRFCMNLAICKGKLTSCESDLKDFIQGAGMALCQKGKAMSKAIMDAADVLSNDSCTGEFEPSGSLPDGCYLQPDNAVLPTYLAHITRRNKVRSAANRCLSRFLESQKYCSASGLRALATLLAASDRVESIGRNYDSYTKYSTPDLGEGRTKLALYGFTHLYINMKKQSTCQNLAGSHILLWNTYIKIDGTTSRLAPTVNTMLLSHVFIQFSNDAGQVIDSYMASTSDEKFLTQTQRQVGGVETSIEVKVITDNLIVLYHSVTMTRIAVASVGQALSILINMPTTLYNFESAGLLVDGCEAYGGSVATDLENLSTEECSSNCTSSSEVDASYHKECAYDCANGVDGHEDIYATIATQHEEVYVYVEPKTTPKVSGTTILAISVSTMLLSLTSLLQLL